MNDELLETWANKLKSGEYEQGESMLRQQVPATGKTEHCCLGVLLEIVDHHGWNDELEAQSHKGSNGVHYLSDAFCASIGLPVEYMKVLGNANDTGTMFDEISCLLLDPKCPARENPLT